MPFYHRFMPASWRADRPFIPVVRMNGPIGMASTPLRPSISMESMAPALEKAFRMEAPAVALLINSPGGSPVQSKLIHDRIRFLASEHDKEVLAFVEDVAASGGYMIACAADTIIADHASILGSIGVVTAGFGFERLMEKIGVERRMHTAGDRKAMLDPFLPEDPDDVRRLKALQKEMHDIFKDVVRASRAERLTGSERLLFSGEFWIGTRALELGLIDGLGNIRQVVHDRYGEKARAVVLPNGRESMLRRFLGGQASSLSGGRLPAGSGLADELIASLEARALWSRYGLQGDK